MVACSDAAATAIDGMQQAHNILTRSLKSTSQPPAEEQSTSKQDLKTLTEAVKLEASKMGFMWGSAEPSQEAAQSLFSALQHRHSQLLTLLCRAGYGAGPTLIASLQSVATPVTQACVAFVKQLSSPGTMPEGQAAIETRKVWAACDAASKACLDNKSAIGRKLVHISKAMKDTVRELHELIAESERCQTDEPPQSAVSDASPDVDLDFETELLTSTELENAQSCLPLLKAVLDLTKSLVQLLLAEGALHDASTVESWESLLFHVKGLADVANDLGAALFAPQELGEVASAADSLNTGCQLVVDELPDNLADAQREGMQDLLSQIECAHASVEQKTSIDFSKLRVSC